MNRYVINGFVLVFWLAISLGDAWGSFRERFDEEKPQIKEQQTPIQAKIAECSNLLNQVQVDEIKFDGARFSQEERNKF